MDRQVKRKNRLFSLAFTLLMLTVFSLPAAIAFTYAGRSESASHVLTYTTGKLTWDSATSIMQNGAASLNLFSEAYANVQSENEDRVVAPGTQKQSIVRLKNSANNPIQYVAVMYRIKEEATLPVAPELSSSGFTQTSNYPLPDGVQANQVVRAVTGTVNAGQIQDFDIAWHWNYDDGAQRDQMDTELGNKAAFAQADDVTAGLYIVVTEEQPSVDPSDPDDPDNSYVYPEVPQTGDSSPIRFYQGLMVISGILLLLLIWDRRKEKKCPKYSDSSEKR